MTIKELREKAQAAFNAAKALNAKALGENRDLTADEKATYDAKIADAKNFAAQADRLEAEEQLGNRFAAPATNAAPASSATPPAANGTPNGNGSLPTNGGPNVINRPDEMRGFRNQGEFLECVLAAGRGGRVDNRLKPLDITNAAGADEMQTGNDAYGGFLVPEGMLPGWLRVEPEPDPMMGRITNVPMETPTVKVPARVDKDHSTSVSGGLTVTRRVETQGGSSSRMKLEQVRLEASSLFGLSYVTEELLSDSPRTIAAILSQGFRDQFQSHLIDERINGTGAGEFLGVLNSPSLVSVAKESAQAADTINGTNILKMRARCWSYGRAIWLANIDTYVQIAKAHVAGTNGDVFLFNPSRGVDVPDTLLGRPIFFTEYVKTLGDKGDLILFVGSEYLEGVYQPLQSAESVHVRFEQHERTFKFQLRNAGAPWWRSALTPKNGTSTLSPFVTLDERA